MQALFALSQHDALVAIQDRLKPEEKLFTFLDDIYVWSGHASHNDGAHGHPHGKPQLWNRAGVAPAGSVALTAAGQVLDPDAIVWRGDTELNTEDQGLVILGKPLGYEDFVRINLAKKSGKHDQLIWKILIVLTCSVLGCFSCAAPPREPTASCGWCNPHLSATFARHQRCVIAPSFGPLPVSPDLLGHGKICRSPTAELVSFFLFFFNRRKREKVTARSGRNQQQAELIQPSKSPGSRQPSVPELPINFMGGRGRTICTLRTTEIQQGRSHNPGGDTGEHGRHHAPSLFHPLPHQDGFRASASFGKRVQERPGLS